MNQVKITARLCGNENELTFKEKFEIARLLEKLCVDVIEFPALSGNKEDALLIRTCASFIKNSVLSVPVLSVAQADEAAACLSGANNAALRVELSVSPVGMEYFHHRKAPKMLELIKELVSYAASKAKKVYFCALDATRAEEEFLKSALLAAEEAGAKAVYLSDDAGEMLPDEFALFAEKFGKVVGIPIGVAVSNKSGFALSSAVLAVRKGVKAVKTVLSGDGISLQAFANCIKNSGARNGIALGVTYTELNRIIARVWTKTIIRKPSRKRRRNSATIFQTKIRRKCTRNSCASRIRKRESARKNSTRSSLRRHFKSPRRTSSSAM